MAKRVPPTSEEIGQFIAETIDKMEPLTTLSYESAMGFIQAQFRTTRQNASRWLIGAVKEDAVIMITSSVEGRHLSRLIKNTFDSPHDLMATELGDNTKDYLIESGTLTIRGKLVLAETLLEGQMAAVDDMHFVTSPAGLTKLIEAINEYKRVNTERFRQEYRKEQTAVEAACGDSLDLYAGLLELAGFESKRLKAFFTQEEVTTSIMLSGADKINALGEILRKAGIQPNQKWRKRI